MTLRGREQSLSTRSADTRPCRRDLSVGHGAIGGYFRSPPSPKMWREIRERLASYCARSKRVFQKVTVRFRAITSLGPTTQPQGYRTRNVLLTLLAAFAQSTSHATPNSTQHFRAYHTFFHDIMSSVHSPSSSDIPSWYVAALFWHYERENRYFSAEVSFAVSYAIMKHFGPRQGGLLTMSGRLASQRQLQQALYCQRWRFLLRAPVYSGHRPAQGTSFLLYCRLPGSIPALATQEITCEWCR